jgi:predicted enzyme related to lactoylglutathione lyase
VLPSIRWTSLFADVPASEFDRALAFWSGVTGATPGDPTGAQGEYVPLVPSEGDPYVWLQRVGRPDGGWHLDVHVPDVEAATRASVGVGASVVRAAADLATLTSPSGQPFCLVEESVGTRRRPPPAEWPSGRSFVDQICIDIPAPAFDRECDFWAALTGWPRRREDVRVFDRLGGPATLPLFMLLQRLGEGDDGGIRAHADLSADQRAGEVERHVALGAELVRVAEHWTTLRDPAGLIYCVTGRQPGRPV